MQLTGPIGHQFEPLFDSHRWQYRDRPQTGGTKTLRPQSGWVAMRLRGLAQGHREGTTDLCVDRFTYRLPVSATLDVTNV